MTRATRAFDDYDIAIVGGGAAGVAAAAVAATGSRVVLIEASHRLGGSVTAAMHRSICGLYSQEPEDAVDTLNDSVQRDVVRRMAARAPTEVRPRSMGKAWVLEFPSAAWEQTLAEILRDSGAEVRFGCGVTGVRRENNRIAAIEVVENDPQATPRWLDVNVLIDCTGGGNILKLIGPEAHQPAVDGIERMLAGFAIRLAGLEGDAELLRLQIPYFLAKAVEKAQLPPTARYTSFYPGPGTGEGICKLAIDLRDSSVGEADALAERVVDYLKGELPAFRPARIVEKSPQILPRDGLRLRGRQMLREQDVTTGQKIGPDCVHAWWPIERWDPSRGPSYAYAPEGEHYDISTGMVQSEFFENLLAAGTCLSATAAAAASSRASGICLATGAMAGEAAIELLR
jgi:hypothetical protein